MKKRINERGSLALEQILFIGAIVAISALIVAFYGDIGNYLSGVGDQISASNPNVDLGDSR